MKNKLGGIEIKDKDLAKAKAADLITLPKGVSGTNCFNCKFIYPTKGDEGHCTHKAVNQLVTSRMCCALWDLPGSIRCWEK